MIASPSKARRAAIEVRAMAMRFAGLPAFCRTTMM
jgi:hypothetical protein